MSFFFQELYKSYPAYEKFLFLEFFDSRFHQTSNICLIQDFDSNGNTPPFDVESTEIARRATAR